MSIISRTNRFIFVHVPKTAGKSLRSVLIEHGSYLPDTPELYLNPNLPTRDPRHARGFKIAAYVGAEDWQSYYSFGFVRNPWDRLVSLYHFVLKTPRHRIHDEVSNMDFTSFALYFLSHDPEPMWNWLADESGNKIVSDVYRFEDLSECYEKIMKRCEIAHPPPLPHLNKSDRGHYRHYYSDNIAEKVQYLYHHEISLFDYSF